MTAAGSAVGAVEIIERAPDLTLAVDSWSRHLAGREYGEGGAYAAGVDAVEQDPMWTGYCRELFGSLYGLSGTPLEEPTAEASQLQRLHTEAQELPEWAELKHAADGEPWACGIAAGTVANAMADVYRKLERERQLEHVRKGETRNAKAEEQVRAGVQGAEVRKALRAACAKAQGEVQDMRDALEGLGAGMTPGQRTTVAAPNDELVAMLRKDPRLMRVAQLAGRLRVVARAQRRQRPTYGREEVADVAPGDDVARLLPSELVLMADPDLELLLLQRLVERSAQCYELRARGTEKQGPIVLAIDTSGSMQGEPYVWAQAASLALLDVAASQGRPFVLLHFDTKIQAEQIVAPGQHVTTADLMTMLRVWSGGGTDCSQPFLRAAELCVEHSWAAKADVICVSDWDTAKPYASIVKHMRAAGVRCYGLIIGPGKMPDGLDGVARLSAHNTGAACDLVFGI